MEVHYSEGVAIRADLESCVAIREDGESDGEFFSAVTATELLKRLLDNSPNSAAPSVPVLPLAAKSPVPTTGTRSRRPC